MNYCAAILEHLIDTYERRGLYNDTGGQKHQGIFFYVEKAFPEYFDNYDGSAYQNINEAIEYLRQQDILQGEKDIRGNYGRLQFNLAQIELCHQLTGRPSLGKTRRTMLELLRNWEVGEWDILNKFRTSQMERLCKNKPLEHGMADDIQKLKDVLNALPALMKLQSEVYIRNFSEAIFADSKRFQKIRGSVESILCAYGEEGLSKKTVLSTYNLLDNPTYILLKGRMHITVGGQVIQVGSIPGGIALPSMSISSITNVSIDGQSLITVENLTTFHDEPEGANAIIYLGGFHNSVRTELLKKIYQENPLKAYFHKGDIDVYGFMILENLKLKTGIPFVPLEMDLATLQEYERYQLVQPLTAADRKMLQLPQLIPYRDVLTYMQQHNCKAEQESRQALFLIHAKESSAGL